MFSGTTIQYNIGERERERKECMEERRKRRKEEKGGEGTSLQRHIRLVYISDEHLAEFVTHARFSFQLHRIILLFAFRVIFAIVVIDLGGNEGRGRGRRHLPNEVPAFIPLLVNGRKSLRNFV
jgi:hypothetical protein